MVRIKLLWVREMQEFVEYRIDGFDRTEEIKSFRQRADGRFEVVFKSSEQPYIFAAGRVDEKHFEIDPQELWFQVINYFKAYCENDALQARKEKKETGPAESALRGLNRLHELDSETVLTDYIKGEIKSRPEDVDSSIIFPFGCNKSQYEAVRMALQNSISVIQGPPGTGKTQTILNLIANILVKGKTIAVVSNNNDAVKNVVDKLSDCGLGWLVADLGNSKKTNAFFENQPEIALDERWAELPPPKAFDMRLLAEKLQGYYENKIRIQQLAEEDFQLDRQLKIFLEEEARDGGTDLRQSNWVSKLKNRSLSTLKFAEKMVESFGSNSGIGQLFLRAVLFLLQLKKESGIKDLKKTVLNALFAVRAGKQHDFLESEMQTLRSLQEGMSDQEKRFFAWSQDALYAAIYERFKDKENEIFCQRGFQGNEEFFLRYPITTSSTFCLHRLRPTGKRFDFLIIDEASQVNLPTAALCFDCAANVVVVGDSKQLPAIIPAESPAPGGDIPEAMDASRFNILDSVISRFGDKLPSVTLREHYRCHPDIIGFCNKQFYDGELVAMTSREGRPEPFSWIDMTGSPVKYRWAEGRVQKSNPRQILQVVDSCELLVHDGVETFDMGVISPYRDQVAGIRAKVHDIEVDTVHKYQGREKNSIIYSAVDYKPNRFNDSPNLINVAVSRAKDRFILVSSDFAEYEKSNLAALVRYIRYLDPKHRNISQSRYRSVFDSLFTGRTENIRKLPDESPAESLFREMLLEVLKDAKFRGMSVVREYPLRFLPRTFDGFSKAEVKFMLNNSRLDFLVFDPFGKQPIAAIEVDGQTHNTDQQKRRDHLKEAILEKLGLPLQRFATRSELGGEKEDLERFLENCIENSAPCAHYLVGKGLPVEPFKQVA